MSPEEHCGAPEHTTARRVMANQSPFEYEETVEVRRRPVCVRIASRRALTLTGDTDPPAQPYVLEAGWNGVWVALPDTEFDYEPDWPLLIQRAVESIERNDPFHWGEQ